MSLYLVQLVCCESPGQDCIVLVIVAGMLVIMSSLVACDLTYNQAVFSCSRPTVLQKCMVGAGEMVWYLRASTVLVEDPCLIPGIYIR